MNGSEADLESVSREVCGSCEWVSSVCTSAVVSGSHPRRDYVVISGAGPRDHKNEQLDSGLSEL
jgi:hypothetical protein